MLNEFHLLLDFAIDMGQEQIVMVMFTMCVSFMMNVNGESVAVVENVSVMVRTAANPSLSCPLSSIHVGCHSL